MITVIIYLLLGIWACMGAHCVYNMREPAGLWDTPEQNVLLVFVFSPIIILTIRFFLLLDIIIDVFIRAKLWLTQRW
jgi:hypothetical protein